MKKDPSDSPQGTLTSTGGLGAEPTAPAAGGSLEMGALAGSRFKIGAIIGNGAMGSVYLARDTISGERVAIKVLRGAGNPETRLARLRRELRAARLITHPGVVRLNDLFILGDRLALSMEYVEGETLAKRLSGTLQLTAEELVSVAKQLAGALAAAHAAGVVHRDLKPANILVRAGSDQLVIADFGISRIDAEVERDLSASADGGSATLTDLTQTRDILGTPSYMAPEQLVPGQTVGPPADVYAVGLILYEAAAGTRPHPVSTLEELQRARQRAEIPPLGAIRPDLPADFVAVVERCLKSDPQARYGTGRALEVALGSPPSGPQLAPAALPEPSPGRPAPRRRFVGSAIVCGTVLLAGALAVSWHLGALPASDRRVWLTVTAAPGSPLQAAAARLAEQLLGERADRFAIARTPGEANVALGVRYEVTGHVVRMEATLGRMGGRARSLGNVEGPAIGPTLTRVLDRAVQDLDSDQALREPDVEERRRMQITGARTLGLLRAYERVLTRYLATAAVADIRSVREEAQRLLDQDPGWAHAMALRSLTDFTTVARLAPAEPGRDAIGQELLASMGAYFGGRMDEAIARQTQLFHQVPDVLVGSVLANSLDSAQRSDEKVALLQRLNELRPDLQFGSDLIGQLSRMERTSDAATFLRRWLERAPEARAALEARQIVAIRRRDEAGVARTFQAQLRLLYGDTPANLLLETDLLVSEGNLGDARQIALQLSSAASVEVRGRGKLRLVTLAVIEGQFSRALEIADGAYAEMPREQGEQVQVLQLQRSVLELIGDGVAARRLSQKMADDLTSLSRPEASSLRLAADNRACPDRLPDVEAGSRAGRSMRVHDLRALVERGCADCRSVLRTGMLPLEPLPWSLFTFARCAERNDQLELARRALEVLEPRNAPSEVLSSSPVHSILARYELGKVLERLGRNDEARAKYESFLATWGNADRPLAQVDDARRRLARLKP